MSKQFDKFLEENPIVKFGDQRHCAELAWEACKKEVLQILVNNEQFVSYYIGEGDDFEGEMIDLDAIEEVEEVKEL